MNEHRVLETLGRYKIDEQEVSEWENTLGLDIPVDPNGNKLYSKQHLNLFKNIKKHLLLGRSITEIKKLLVLPVEKKIEARMHSVPEPVIEKTHPPETHTIPSILLAQPSEKNILPLGEASITPSIRPIKRFASLPRRLSSGQTGGVQRPNTGLLLLVDRLMAEKDELQSTLVKLEKQKTHLFQGNEMFKERVSELQHQILQLDEQLKVQENIQLMDDKAKLQKELILAERRQSEVDHEVTQLQKQVQHLKASLANQIEPRNFIGSWLQEAHLKEVVFDNFGINIENTQSRIVKITTPPERLFGHTAIIETSFDYQTNTLWKRTETLVVSILSENRLQGELIAEYTLDGTPVARAIYTVTCQRQGARS